MNSQKIPYNQIENKIRQFKLGDDYRFEGEKYYSPDSQSKGYTTRTYQINSPQLNEIIKDYLTQQNDILMSFDFKGKAFIDEKRFGNNSKKDWNFSCDENGNSLNYDSRGKLEERFLSILFFDKPKQGFNQQYQVAKKAWEVKGSPVQNTPPSGTKCWGCYQVISDADIAAGRYKLKNTRLGTPTSDKLTFFKIFEHEKGVCKPVEYDCAERNNYRYHSELKDIWLEYPQKKHEYSCQDCLTRFWHEVNGNLIYLETWAKEQVQEIAHTKQILAEIKARLEVLEKTGEFHNCGIKKCCEQHDKPDHSQPKNKGLIAAAPLEEENFPEPKKPTFDKQEVLNWMKKMGIVEISLDPSNSEQLLIKYTNGKTDHWKIAEDLPQAWGQFLKQEVSTSPISLNSQTSPNNKSWGGPITAFSLLIGGIMVGLVVGILIYRQRKPKKV